MNRDEEANLIWNKSLDLSNTYGPLILEEVNGLAAEATTTSAVLLASFCISADISMHSAVELLMSAYKGILKIREEDDKE